jgi:hypothetical protein
VGGDDNPAPLFEFLEEYKVPLWRTFVGYAHKPKICIIFSHGNKHDVPESHPLLLGLLQRLADDYFIVLFEWDYPGYSYSPLSTAEYPQMEQQFANICANVIQNPLFLARQEEEQVPIFLMGHSLGAALQSCIFNCPTLEQAVTGVYFVAPFLSLRDMCYNVQMIGPLVYHAAVKDKDNLFNLANNIKYRDRSKPTKLRCVLFVKDQVVSHGLATFDKFMELNPKTHGDDPDWVLNVAGTHNALMTDPAARDVIRRDLFMFVKSSIGQTTGDV